jgi:transposase
MLAPTLLLPDAACLHLLSVAVDPDGHTITVHVASRHRAAPCPTCGHATTRVHSHYQRTLADLPVPGWLLRLHLNVRKFRCTNTDCPQRIFCERLPPVAAPWARRTQRLRQAQRAIGLAVGGAAGARLALKRALPTGRDTLLTLVRTTPVPRPVTLTTIGIDDWARRKGQTYGTIVVDLITHCPLALLPDRSAEGVAHWLGAYPSIETVSRDRWNAYAIGITAGAPTAIQVADRFHLVQNMGATLLRVLQSHHGAIERPWARSTVPSDPPAATMACASSTRDRESAPPRTQRERERTQRAATRQARIAQAHQLHAAGGLQRAIAAHLSLHPRTIRRYLRQDPTTAGPVIRRTRRCLLDPYRTYLLERWNAGCRNAVQLLGEIQAQGYRGQITRLRCFLAEVRSAQGLPPCVRSIPPGGTTLALVPKPPSMRQLAWLVLKRPPDLQPREQAYIEHACGSHPHVATAIALAQDFATIIRQRQADRLDAWLEHVEASGIRAMRNFAVGLRQDADAVRAALRLPYSNGPVEGQINRLKLLKRQSYGRAKLDLLERRLLAG